MACELTPVIFELFDKAIIRSELLLEVAFGVHIKNYSQAVIEDHLHGAVEIPQVIRRNAVGLAVPEHRLRINTQPHMIESHGLNQGDILRGVPRSEERRVGKE